MVFTFHTEMHRAPAYWVRPDEFLPERWLVEPGQELQPMEGVYLALKIGPRACIVQGLVMIELRVVLVCIVRQFELKPAYDEWDRVHPKMGRRSYRGEWAYQLMDAVHSVEHYTCRVSVQGTSANEHDIYIEDLGFDQQ